MWGFMDFTIISKSDGAAVIEKGNEKYLAINSGLKNKSFLGVNTSKLQSLPGLIIGNEDIKNWKLEGITEIDGITYQYGPYLKGKTLPNLELTPKLLLELTNALHIIKDKKFPVRQFNINSIFRTDDGKILFFPPLLMDYLNSHRSGKDSLKMIDPWNNPKLGGNKGRAFTIATLVYKLITGEQPFNGKSEEEILKSIETKNYKSPLLFHPGLKKEILDLLVLSFKGEATLIQWKILLSSWIDNDFINPSLTDAEKENITRLEIKKEKKRILNIKIVEFFHKNKNRLLAGLTGALLLAAVLQAPISKYLAPPVTLGMSQREVIDLYYDCFRTMNTEILEDCITNKAGKGDINEISTIFVTSKVRSSYEGTSGLLQPDQWIQDGRLPLKPGVQIWGITDMKIKRLSDDSFEASYLKWQPKAIDDPEDMTLWIPEGYIIKDFLHLSLIDDAWKIDQLNRQY